LEINHGLRPYFALQNVHGSAEGSLKYIDNLGRRLQMVSRPQPAQYYSTGCVWRRIVFCEVASVFFFK